MGSEATRKRKEQRQRQKARRASRWAAIEAAHRNDGPPPPVPVRETREQRIVNDQLRSRGCVRQVETGSIAYRMPKRVDGRERWAKG